MKSQLENLVTCDLGGTKLLVRVCVKGQCIDRQYATGIDFSPAKLQSILAKLETEFSLKDYPLAIAFPGLLKAHECFMSNVVPQFDGYPLVNLTENGTLHLVLNDVEAGTYGIISDQSSVEILIMAGTGIGMGISIDGKVFRGEKGFSGELGSCRIERQGDYLRMAKIASGSALKANANITQTSSGRDLGMAVSWVINCFNPGRLVFAGGMMNEIEYRNACFDAIEKLTLGPSYNACNIELEPEMHSIVVRGLEVALKQFKPELFQ